MSDDSKKTVANDPLLGELIQLNLKVAACHAATTRVVDAQTAILQRLTQAEHRIGVNERRTSEGVEAARTSVADLESHILFTETAMVARFTDLSTAFTNRQNSLEGRVKAIDSEMGTQTTKLDDHTTILKSIVAAQADAAEAKAEADNKRKHQVALIAVLAPIIIAGLATLGNYFVQRNVPSPYAYPPAYQTLPQPPNVSTAK